MCYTADRTSRPGSAKVFSESFLDGLIDSSDLYRLYRRRAAPGRRGPGGASSRVRPANGSGSACQGRCHCWLVPSPQDQIWTWVPEPPKPVSSRHLPDSGLTSSPLDWACHCCAPVPLQVYRSTRVPLAVPAPSTSRHMPSTSRVPLDSTVHCWALVPLQV